MLDSHQKFALAIFLAWGLALGLPAAAADKKPVSPTSTLSDVKTEEPVETRILELHERLRVTPPEEQSFKAMANVMRANDKTYESLKMEQFRSERDANAVDDLKFYARLAQTRADNARQLALAFETFYGTLSDEQKKTADQVLRNVRRPMADKTKPKHPERSKTAANTH